MKIIALLMVKNESWILPTYLSGMKDLADEVIAIDDGSTDDTKHILQNAGAIVLENHEVWKSGTPEFSMRQRLLEEGRKRGGTHFICLDADEAFSLPFRQHGREIISQLKPGQKLLMQWMFLWKDPYIFIDDKRSLFKDNYKDLVFCDSQDLQHSFAFMHVGRTPGLTTDQNSIRLEPQTGACLHFTFVNWNRCMLKQAWCRCSDLIHEPGRYVKINNKYYFPEKNPGFKFSPIPKEWFEGLVMPANIENLPPSWHLKTVISFFDRFGIENFEPLEIWDIPELRTEFVKRVGRQPKPSVLHIYLQPLIKLRRHIKKIIK